MVICFINSVGGAVYIYARNRKIKAYTCDDLCLLTMLGSGGRTGRRLLSSSSSLGPLRVCIIGSGPAGFYTAHQLIKVLIII